ncbi:MAG: hypothetical protein OCD01_04990 [Fibrobacterales bacterium]
MLKTLLTYSFPILFSLLGCGSAQHSDEFYGAPIQENEVLTDSRDSYGKNSVAVWTPLTPFEEKLISTENSNYRTLLGLGLAASGDVRTLEQFNTALKRIDIFIKRLSPMIAKQPTFQKRGEILFKEMQKSFYPQILIDNSAYDFDQSKLTTLLDSGAYNCISSALLYALLAERFNLNPQGVILPEHAYIQIEDDANTIIEVETTSSRGFNQVHDETFYKQYESGWFFNSGTAPLTYEDYLNRTFLTVDQLAKKNFSNQHTSYRFTGLTDRLRLIELRYQFNRSDTAASINLMYFYQWELKHLISKRDYASLDRFMNIFKVNGASIVKTFPNDSNFSETFTWGLLQKAVSYQENHKFTQSMDELELMHHYLDSLGVSTEKVESYIIGHYQSALMYFDSTKQYKEGMLYQDTYARHCSKNTVCSSTLGLLTYNYSNQLWNKKQWEEAIKIYNVLLDAPYQTPLQEHSFTNREGAYYNWAIEYSNNQQWDDALALLDQCISLSEDYLQCASLKENYSQRK